MATPLTPDFILTPSRHEKSLGLLTTKFVSLLQEAKDGVLDLKIAADTLAVRQKRRIYDITNVLEGIGLIEKRSKNSIQWKGGGPACNTREVTERLAQLTHEYEELRKIEAELDQHKSWVQQSIRNVTEDISNHNLAYATHEDVCRCFHGDTLLAIQAPSGTQLEVPVPEDSGASLKKYQIHLKSQSGPINVLLVNKDVDSSSPVVVQVPPPAELLVPQEKQSKDNPQPSVEVDFQAKGKSPRGKVKRELETSTPPRMVTRSSPRKRQQAEQQPSSSNQLSPVNTSVDELFINSVKDPIMEVEYLDDLMTSDVFSPLLRLSPPPSDKDYYFNLDDTEGMTDLFDVPMLGM